MGPTGFAGLNAAVKQRLVMKHESLRPLMSQSLLKMLILLGLKEAVALRDATPLDLKTKQNFKLNWQYKYKYSYTQWIPV